MNKQTQDEIFNEIFNEIENMTKEDVDQMNQNIDNEVKNKQIEKFGVLYSNLKTKSQFSEFNLFCKAIQDILKKNNQLKIGEFIIHKIKINENLFENENLEILFTQKDYQLNYFVIKITPHDYYESKTKFNFKESLPNVYLILHDLLELSYNLNSQSIYDKMIQDLT